MMNSEVDDAKAMIDDAELDEVEDLDEATDPEKTVRMLEEAVLDETDAATDNVGDVSVEINVEELIADIEASEDKDAAHKREIRRRLEDAVEGRSFDDTYAIDLDEEAD